MSSALPGTSSICSSDRVSASCLDWGPAGGDRQRVHETIRRHSLAAARALADGAERNDLFERLETDAEFRLAPHELREAAEAKRFVGRAPEQVDEFLAEVVEPLLARAGSAADISAELRV